MANRTSDSYFDICLLYSEIDEDEGEWFRDLLEKFIKLEYTDGSGETRTVPCRIATLGRQGDLPEAPTVIQHINMAVDRSQYVFLYVTDNFLVDSQTRYQGCTSSGLLVDKGQNRNIIPESRRWTDDDRAEYFRTVEAIKHPVPIFTKQKKDFQYPPELKHLPNIKGITILNLLARLPRCSVADITLDHITNADKFFVKGIHSSLQTTLEKRLLSSGEIVEWQGQGGTRTRWARTEQGTYEQGSMASEYPGPFQQIISLSGTSGSEPSFSHASSTPGGAGLPTSAGTRSRTTGPITEQGPGPVREETSRTVTCTPVTEETSRTVISSPVTEETSRDRGLLVTSGDRH